MFSSEQISKNALSSGILLSSNASSKDEVNPKIIPSYLKKRKCLDVVRKNANSKPGRFFCIVPFQFQMFSNISASTSTPKEDETPCTETIGRLEKLDTETPVMYLDFAEGRIKLYGALVPVTSNLITFKFRPSIGLSCEDQFDQVLLFSKYAWIGKAEDNQNEDPLPFPRHLLKVTEVKASCSSKSPIDEENEESDHDEDDEQSPSSTPLPVRSTRKQPNSAKRTKLLLDDDDISEHEESQSSPSLSGTRRSTPVRQSKTKSLDNIKRSLSYALEPLVFSDEEGEEEDNDKLIDGAPEDDEDDAIIISSSDDGEFEDE